MMMMKKIHIYSLRKNNGSKKCTNQQECYKIKTSCLIKPLKKDRGGFFKHNHTKDIKLYIKIFILLDNCSTIDLFYNSDLVENINKTGKKMTVKDNGGTLAVTHKETVPGYKQYVWFSKYAITSIIYLKKLIKQ